CGDPVRCGLSVQSLASLGYWVARSSRAMTIECAFAISRHELPEVCIFVRPLFQRAQGRPGACCTRGLACDLRKQKLHTSIQGSGNTPAFPAQWLYGLLRALPGER